MNYLAHCCLVPPTSMALAGSIFGDVIHGKDLSHLPLELARAVRLHRMVDAYTDAHPENCAARALFTPPFRRFAGVMIDLVYDHFLARDFEAHEGSMLAPFSATVYHALEEHMDCVPAAKQHRIRYIAQAHLLESYLEIQGVYHALSGIAQRLSRPTPLAYAEEVVKPTIPSLQRHFDRFYPQLKHWAAQQWVHLSASTNA